MAFRTMGSGDPSEGEGAIVAEINITPLTDIFLVLLIIFMVTSSVMSQLGVDVNLPQASNQTSQSEPEGIVVTLLPSGALKINDAPIGVGDYGKMENVLTEAFK